MDGKKRRTSMRSTWARVRIRVAAKCAERSEAGKVARECVMLMGTGPIVSTGQLNTPAPREVFALWPTLIPREEVVQTVEIREIG